MVRGVRELRRTIAQLRRTLQWCGDCGAPSRSCAKVREVRRSYIRCATLRRSNCAIRRPYEFFGQKRANFTMAKK